MRSRRRVRLSVLRSTGLTTGLVVGVVSALVVATISPSLADANEAIAAPAPGDLDALLSAYASMPGFEARFEEEKHVALLMEPLRSRGRLFFAPPSTLLRRVEAPRPIEILVTPRAVRIRDAARTQTIDLASRSEARPLVESLLWLFTGDRAALERAYRIAFSPAGEAGWLLELTPRAAPLDQLLEVLRVRGHGLASESIELVETSGDRTLTRIFDANPARRFDDAERARLFDASPRQTGHATPPFATQAP